MVADAESRTVAHNKWAPKREPLLGALYEGHVPKYKLLWEGYSDGYVTPNWELSYRKPQHLMTLDERWASYTENKRKGMEHRHAEYM